MLLLPPTCRNRPPPLDHVNRFRHHCRYQRRAVRSLFTSIGMLYSHRRNTHLAFEFAFPCALLGFVLVLFTLARLWYTPR